MTKSNGVLVSLAIALAASLVGCEKSAEEAQRAALAKQEQANKVATEAQAKADTTQREAENSAQKAATEAQNEAARKTAAAQLQADDATRQAQLKADEAQKLAAERAHETYDQFTYRAEHDLTDLQRRATLIAKSAPQSGDDARKSKVMVNDVQAKGVAIRSDIKAAKNQSGDVLTSTKAKVDRSLDDLKRVVDDASPAKP